MIVDSTLKFQSGVSLVALINRFFDKLPRSGFTKDRVKIVVGKFAETYVKNKTRIIEDLEKLDKNQLESTAKNTAANHKIDKMIIIDYINKCINLKIQKLVTQTFL